MAPRRSDAGGCGEAIEPAKIVAALLALDPNLCLKAYYSEESVFYNPRRAAPLGVIFASLKDHDGPNDAASALSRPGVYRLAFQLPRAEYLERFGPQPPRPPKGGVITGDFNLQQLDRLTPHPVYGWMRWVQVLCPSAPTFAALEPLLADSLDLVRAKWRQRSET